jgi:hypothetical protein
MVVDRGPFVASVVAERKPAASSRGRGRISHAPPIRRTAKAPASESGGVAIPQGDNARR